MPDSHTVSAHVALTLARHIDHVFGVMGNGNAYFLDALERVHRRAVHRGAARGRRRRRRRRVPPRLGAPRRRDRDVRRRLHQHAHGPRRGGAGARAARARRRRRADLGSAPVGRRPDRPRVGRRCAHVHRRASGCRGHDRHRHRARPHLPGADGARDPLRRRRARRRAGAGGAGAAASRARSPRPGTVRRAARRATSPRRSRGARRPFLLAGRGAWISGAGEALGALADATGALTASTALGRGVFPRSEFDLGVTGGFGAEGAMELVREADVAVVFGASLNQFTMRFGDLFAPGTRIFQVDIAPTATHPHVGGYVRGDARLVARGDRARGAEDRSRADRLARVGRRGRGPRATTPATGWHPTAGSTRARSPRGSASSCPRTASSSRTAATSSAGRTCTGPSRRPTA